MAQKTTITFIDDLTGDEILDGAGGTVAFGFDGSNYEIDLADANRDELRKALEPYIAAARKKGGRGARATTSTTTSQRSDASELAKIREWASANGHEVSSRGRIAQTVRDAYAAAH